ncbi:hypothetical protein G7Y79_00024g056460 [Physcia stellaris]|nr:hypothetical protein G7Y79_00024g056460 [Physcia stellaris]
MEVKHPKVIKHRVSLDMLDTMVQIEVGPTKTVFQLHKGLLCNVAAYFRAALEGAFIEAQQQKIEMPDEDPEIFKRFQYWLYTGSLLDDTIPGGDILMPSVLADIFIFAEARGIPSLQNAAIDALIDQRYLSPPRLPHRCLHRIYDNTPEDSPLRKLVVAMYADGSVQLTNACWMSTQNLKDYPSEFLRDIICVQYTRLAAFKVVGKDFKGLREDFHVPVANDSGSQPKAGEV